MQDANVAGFKNVMIKVKKIEDINQRRNEEMQKKADERKRYFSIISNYNESEY